MLLRPLLAFTILSLSTLAGALTAHAELPRDCYFSSPGYELQMFREQESQMIQWDQIYNNSSYGSARSREADIKRQAHARAALEMLGAQGALMRQPHAVLSDLSNDLINRANYSSYGSFRNRTYRSAQDIAVAAYVQKGIENVRCDTLSGQEALDGARHYQNLESNSSYGSVKNVASRQLREVAFESALQKITQELRMGGVDFRSLQSEGARYSSLESNTSYGSAGNVLYRALKETAYQSALESLQRQLRYVSSNELFSLEQNFESRANYSSYGSATNVHFRAAREMVTTEISRRTYNLIPSPVPAPTAPNRCPDPNTHFDSRIGRCVANR